MRVHGAGKLTVVNCPPPHRALYAGTVDRGRVAGRGLGGAILCQGGEGRVLRENLGQESRMETCKAMLCQGGCSPSSNYRPWLNKSTGALSAADEGRMWEVQTTGCPACSIMTVPHLLHGGVRGLLQLA